MIYLVILIKQSDVKHAPMAVENYAVNDFRV